MSKLSEDLHEAVDHLNKGEIIAYPTEGVYGLGCDPFNEKAVKTLLKLKGRDVSKGLIIIASRWEQIDALIQPLNDDQLNQVNNTWPGPTTWLFPASNNAPAWITGNHKTIGIRFTDHPLAKALCELYQKPLVSTSANLTATPPARDFQTVIDWFDDRIAFILKGKVGGLNKPSSIRDLLTGRIVRP